MENGLRYEFWGEHGDGELGTLCATGANVASEEGTNFPRGNVGRLRNATLPPLRSPVPPPVARTRLILRMELTVHVSPMPLHGQDQHKPKFLLAAMGLHIQPSSDVTCV